MPEDSGFDISLAALSQFFVGDKTMQETLQRVVDATRAALPDADLVGITMLSDGSVKTAVFTDPESREIDDAQYGSGDGPCVESYRTGEIYRIESTRADGPWRAFREACVRHGILSTLSVPLVVEDESYGALNLYSHTENAFGGGQIETAMLFGAQAAIVLANATVYWTARSRGEQLDDAMRSRAVIEQAKGIVMATMRCDPDQAFDVLVQQSQHQNRKLHDVAAEIVANATRHD